MKALESLVGGWWTLTQKQEVGRIQEEEPRQWIQWVAQEVVEAQVELAVEVQILKDEGEPKSQLCPLGDWFRDILGTYLNIRLIILDQYHNIIC